MQTIWAAVMGADDQEEETPSAGSTYTAPVKPQVAVITAAGHTLALIDITVAASSTVPAFVNSWLVLWLATGNCQFHNEGWAQDLSPSVQPPNGLYVCYSSMHTYEYAYRDMHAGMQ